MCRRCSSFNSQAPWRRVCADAVEAVLSGDGSGVEEDCDDELELGLDLVEAREEVVGSLLAWLVSGQKMPRSRVRISLVCARRGVALARPVAVLR